MGAWAWQGHAPAWFRWGASVRNTSGLPVSLPRLRISAEFELRVRTSRVDAPTLESEFAAPTPPAPHVSLCNLTRSFSL